MQQDELRLLLGEVGEGRRALEKIDLLYRHYGSRFRDEGARGLPDAVMLAEILGNTYTCIETVLFRISRVFENHLDSERWHKHLLQKMHIEVPGLRPAVLSPETFKLLDELRRFRHFKRYYYEFDYDWLRLEFLMTVYERMRPRLEADLDRFSGFLESLLVEADGLSGADS
ncbi:hypothetical protein Thiowin_01880 [Thiorhodovibrio winogradskyi]|uniref:HepT-like domain-containing protein n=1 Tax=Thiorhodovibrio winogradskyi TaxID=77007 RepID=A0ABZ0SBD1_9GAMM|nr:hypothetical protein [Thiorhodovibrio winogradskyi]